MDRTAVVDWAREITEDLDFKAARSWLDENPGRGACGYLPVYAPREVIHVSAFSRKSARRSC